MRRHEMNRTIFLLTILMSGTTVFAIGNVPSAEQIVENANRVSYYQGKDGRAEVSMTITDSQGRARHRRFIILRRDEPPTKKEKKGKPDSYCGDQQFYVYFQKPADVAKMVFMVWKHLNRDDDRWLYLPALDLVKRIASSDKRTSFVGSNFFYEDVSGRGINEDRHELMEVTKTLYELKNIPKNPQSVEFSYYIVWIYKKNFLPIKTEYFDKNGKKYREYSALKVENIQGYPTVTKAVMKDLRTQGQTVLQYNAVKYNIGLPKRIFTERYLRKPPMKYLGK